VPAGAKRFGELLDMIETEWEFGSRLATIKQPPLLLDAFPRCTLAALG